jgi:HSP20 family protein
MRLRSLVPSREREGNNMLMRPDFGVFGLHREIDRLFNDLVQGTGLGGSQGNIAPNIEIAETDQAIEISAEMPGLERNDVDISIEDDTLTIRGEKRVQEDQGDKNVQHSERVYGVFLRVLQLPPGIDPSSVQATMSNGVLKITIPKPAKPEPKKIEVKDAPQAQQAADKQSAEAPVAGSPAADKPAAGKQAAA